MDDTQTPQEPPQTGAEKAPEGGESTVGKISIADLGQEHIDTWAGLSEKARRMVMAYIRTGSPSAAYREATGYKGDVKSAGKMAYKTLRLPKVVAFIEEYHNTAAKQFFISNDRIKAGFAKIAFVDFRDFFNPDGTFKRVQDLPRECADMIAGFEVEEIFSGTGENRVWVGYTKKIKLIPRIEALNSLARAQGMFNKALSAPGDEDGEGARVVRMPAKPQSIADWQKQHAGNK